MNYRFKTTHAGVILSNLYCRFLAWLSNGIARTIAFPNGVWERGRKIAVVSGAIAGGGLAVIANAPNPAGQSLLQKFFPGGISPGGLLLAALAPTVVMLILFALPR